MYAIPRLKTEKVEKEVSEGNRDDCINKSRELFAAKKEDIEKEIDAYFADIQITDEQKANIEKTSLANTPVSILPD